MVLYGFYHFFPRSIAICKDYCEACHAETITEQWRVLKVLHIFFIPLVPWGLPSYWICASCGNDPRPYTRTRPQNISRWLNYGLLAVVLSIAVWYLWVSPSAETGLWVMRIIAPLCVLVVIYFGFFRKSGVDEEAILLRRRQIVPYEPSDCPYCHQPLIEQPERRCARCKLRVYRSARED